MTTSISSQQNALQIIGQAIAGLRSRLRNWMLVHGVGRWLAIVIGIIFADMVIDRTFEMDRPQRWIMLFVMAAVALWFLWTLVIRPLTKGVSDDALVDQIEQRNNGTREQILSAIQLSRDGDLSSTGASPQLVDATILAGVEKARAIDFSSSLNAPQHASDCRLLAFTGGVLACLLIGTLFSSFLFTWFSRNVLLSRLEWPQPTYLVIDGVDDGSMVLPLGAKHRQLVTITQDSAVTDVDVNLEVENGSGVRTVYPMSPTGKLDGRQRVLELNVTGEFRFRAAAENSATTEWVDVTCVQPPAITSLDLRVLPPTYTGQPAVPLSGNGPFAVLQGSQMTIAATSNKSLTHATLTAAGKTIDVPVAGDAKSLNIRLPSEDGQIAELVGGDYELKVVDQTGLKNVRRSRFAITIKEDKSPKIRADLLGISSMVTTRAMIPVSWQAADDYGLSQLYFDTSWQVSEDSPASEKRIDFDLPSADGDGSAGTPMLSASDVQVLMLETLPLQPGTSLRMTVNAKDNRPAPAGFGASKEFLLRVVSDEELRSDLLRREIEQRKAFEQIYNSQMQLNSDTEILVASRPGAGADVEAFHRSRESALIALIRTQKGIGTSVDRIANLFEDFLVEVKNNRLDEAENELAPDQRIETRFDQKIIGPIRRMDQELISFANRGLDNCRRLETEGAKFNDAAQETMALQTAIAREMRTILSAMNNSETFQEIINEMLNVKASTASIGQGIRKIRSSETIETVEDAKGIFDD